MLVSHSIQYGNDSGSLGLHPHRVSISLMYPSPSASVNAGSGVGGNVTVGENRDRNRDRNMVSLGLLGDSQYNPVRPVEKYGVKNHSSASQPHGEQTHT